MGEEKLKRREASAGRCPNCRTLSEVPDVVRRDAKRLSDVVRLKNGIKSRGFDINQTNMDASDVIAPVDPPRTRSALAAIHQQAMKGLRAPSTPLEVKLNDELSASAIKTKQARDKLELRGAIVQQTKDAPAASWSWSVGRNTLDIDTAEASYSSALTPKSFYKLSNSLSTKQRWATASLQGRTVGRKAAPRTRGATEVVEMCPQQCMLVAVFSSQRPQPLQGFHCCT